MLCGHTRGMSLLFIINSCSKIKFYGGEQYEEVFLSFCECLWHFFIHSFFSLFSLFLKRSVFLSYSFSPPSPPSHYLFYEIYSTDFGDFGDWQAAPVFISTEERSMRRSALRTYTGYVPTFYYQFMFKNKILRR